jgi:riboflavin transporter FmnP
MAFGMYVRWGPDFAPPLTFGETAVVILTSLSFFVFIAGLFRINAIFHPKEKTVKKTDTRQVVLTALLAATAYLIMLLIRIPIPPFLTLDPKDVFIVFGGFLFGPLTAFGVAVTVGFLEMVTVSATGPYGMLMNVVSSASFVCTASLIYKKWRTMRGAVAGLAAGVIFMTITMILWNFIITPVYMGIPREVIRDDFLLQVFLPFNLLKGGINAAAAMLLYKPLITALRKMGMVSQPSSGGGKISIAGIAGALFVLGTCILFILIW